MFTQARAAIERLATLLTLVLACGLGAAMYMVFQPLPAVEKRTELAQPAPGAAAQSPGPESLIALLEPAPPVSTDAPEATQALPLAEPTDTAALPFTVKGIIFSTRGNSVAFIDMGDGNDLYAVGESIAGWQIASIERGIIVVTRNGEERTLYVGPAAYAKRPNHEAVPPDKPVSVAAVSAPRHHDAAVPRTSGRNRSDRPDRADMLRQMEASSQAQAPTPIRRDDVDATVAVPEAVADQARSQPEDLMQGVKLSAARDNGGKMTGIAVDQVASGSLGARYGLAPGDRIMAVNGQAITSPAKAMQLYQKYRNDNQVTVTLLRGGAPRKVRFCVQ